jgi:hypothetical protein
MPVGSPGMEMGDRRDPYDAPVRGYGNPRMALPSTSV